MVHNLHDRNISQELNRVNPDRNIELLYLLQCLESTSFRCESGSRIRTGKQLIRIQVMTISLRFSDFLCLSFFVFFMLKLDKPFRDEEIFDNISFFNSSDLGFENIRFLFTVFSWQLAPWSRIRGSAYFSGSGIQEVKMLRFQRIRILSTEFTPWGLDHYQQQISTVFNNFVFGFWGFYLIDHFPLVK